MTIWWSVILLAVALFEPIAFWLGPIFVFLAFWLWVIWGALAIGFSTWQGILSIGYSLKSKQWFNLFFLGVALFVLIQPIHQPLANFEAVQQLSEAGRILKESPENIYISKIFLGYPARQYVLTYIPTLIFGPGFLPARLGYSWPVILGFLTLYAGCGQWFRGKSGEVSFGLILAMVLSSCTFIRFYQHFEQVILPPAFLLNFLGCGFLLLTRTTVIRLFSAAWWLGLLGACYTPGLGALGIVGFIVAIWILQLLRTGNRQLALNAALALFYAASVAVSNRMTRSAELTTVAGNIHSSNDIWQVISGAFELIFISPEYSLFGVFVAPIVLVYLLRSMMGGECHYNTVIAWGSIIVFLLAFLLQGYAAPPPQIAIQRCLVLVPLLAVAILLNFWDTVGDRAEPYLRTLGLLLLTSAVINLYSYQARGRKDTLWLASNPRVGALLSELNRDLGGLDSDQRGALTMVIRQASFGDWNLNDYLPYFFGSFKRLETASKTQSEKSDYCDLTDIEAPAVFYVEAALCSESIKVNKSYILSRKRSFFISDSDSLQSSVEYLVANLAANSS